MSPMLNPDHLSPTGIRVTPAACPICGAPITADETFSVRECGHAALRTASGVLVSSTSIQASRDRIGQWAYGPTNTYLAQIESIEAKAAAAAASRREFLFAPLSGATK